MHFCIQIHIAVYKMEYIYIFRERLRYTHTHKPDDWWLISPHKANWYNNMTSLQPDNNIFFTMKHKFRKSLCKNQIEHMTRRFVILFCTLSLPTPINMNQRMSFLNLYIGIGSTVAFGDPSDVGRWHTGEGFEAEAFILLTVCTDGFLLLLEFPLDRSLTESEG